MAIQSHHPRKLLAVLAAAVLIVTLWIFSSAKVSAQDTDPPTLPPTAPSPPPTSTIPLGNGVTYSAEVDKADIESYNAAINDCSTPSLECLVHYTFTYVNIEILARITGTGAAEAGGSTPLNYDTSGNRQVSANTTQNRGFLGDIAKLVGNMYATPVAGTGPFIADVLENARIVSPAYAQGLGFVSLNPVLKLWKVFRNLAYTFFVLVFIVIGFMIMFRKKMGQAVITAQQAIPSVLSSLVFVTFSYAIAGFLIDLMYLTMYLIVGVFENVGNFDDNVINMDILRLSGVLFKAADPKITSNIVETFLSAALSNETIGDTFKWVGGLTVSVVIAVALLIGTFKLFFELLQDYARVILYVVTAPIMLMAGAIPGKNVFGDWIKKIVGNLLPFPTVLMVVVMFYFFVDGTTSGTGGFMPPFLFGRGQASAISSLMGLAIILALPEIVKHFREQVAGKGGLGDIVYNAGMKAAESGWKGGELVPGMAWSNTNNLPWGGISGRNLLSKPFIGTKESRKAADQDGWRGDWNTFGLGRGLAGEAWARASKLRRMSKINKAKEPDINVKDEKHAPTRTKSPTVE